MVRTEKGKNHLNWSKGRALKYLERDDIAGAWDSILSDLGTNEELAVHPAIELGDMLVLTGNLNTKEAMKKFIEDFE